MFKQNNQPSLFSFKSELSQKQQHALQKTREKTFYEIIFRNIKETDFQDLYANTKSRPNTPVNILASAIILKEMKNISYDDLMESIMFDLRFKTALGLENIDDIPFARSTIFNFQNKILDYENTTGINLFESIFNNLSEKQLKELSIKTNIQRTDSTLISSNIKKFSRIQLLIEILLRLERIFNESDKKYFSENLKPYLKISSQKYVYGLKSIDFPRELESLGKIYNLIFNHIENNTDYSNTKEYINFIRVFKEHFIVIKEEVTVKPNSELNSSMLQSPDDQEATYRKKREQESKGFTINATETANPTNPIQLINDVAVNPNNIDDTKILNERIDDIKERTPDLEEMHTDGGYGSEDNDEKFDKLNITQITTAVRGKKIGVEIKITQASDTDSYNVKCAYQEKKSIATPKRNKVVFDMKQCNECPLKEKCQIFKNKGKLYFTHQDYLKNKRNNNIHKIPPEHQKIRANVEATMKEFKSKTSAGKLKVRGLFKTRIFAYSVAIAINFGRIFRYIIAKNGGKSVLNYFLSIFIKILTSYNHFKNLYRSFIPEKIILGAEKYFFPNMRNYAF